MPARGKQPTCQSRRDAPRSARHFPQLGHFVVFGLLALELQVVDSVETCPAKGDQASTSRAPSLVQGSVSVSRRSSAALLEFELPGESFIRSSIGGSYDSDGSLAAWDERGAPAPTPAPNTAFAIDAAAEQGGVLSQLTPQAAKDEAAGNTTAADDKPFLQRISNAIHTFIDDAAAGNLLRMQGEQAVSVGDGGMATIAWLIFAILVILICGATAVLTMEKTSDSASRNRIRECFNMQRAHPLQPFVSEGDPTDPKRSMAAVGQDPLGAAGSRSASSRSIPGGLGPMGPRGSGGPPDSSHSQEMSRPTLPVGRAALAPELLVPEGRSCLLHVPVLPDVGEVTIDSLGGQPLFVLHAAAQKEVLTLVSYKGDRKVFGLSRRADNATRMVIYDQMGKLYGTVYADEQMPNCYVVGTPAGVAWLQIKLTSETSMNMIVEDRGANILAAMEPDPPSGSPLGPHQAADVATRRLLRIGPQVDVGLIILAVLSTEVMVQWGRQ